MIALTKALIPGLILTFVVALVMGSTGTTGAWLNIFHVNIEGIRIYWSSPLFLATTAVSWGILSMME